MYKPTPVFRIPRSFVISTFTFHFSEIKLITNFSLDEVEIFRCLILGESALEQTINESVSQSKDFRKDELFRKASDYLMHGLQLCDRNKERHVSIFFAGAAFC